MKYIFSLLLCGLFVLSSCISNNDSDNLRISSGTSTNENLSSSVSLNPSIASEVSSNDFEKNIKDSEIEGCWFAETNLNDGTNHNIYDCKSYCFKNDQLVFTHKNDDLASDSLPALYLFNGILSETSSSALTYKTHSEEFIDTLYVEYFEQYMRIKQNKSDSSSKELVKQTGIRTCFDVNIMKYYLTGDSVGNTFFPHKYSEYLVDPILDTITIDTVYPLGSTYYTPILKCEGGTDIPCDDQFNTSCENMDGIALTLPGFMEWGKECFRILEDFQKPCASNYECLGQCELRSTCGVLMRIENDSEGNENFNQFYDIIYLCENRLRPGKCTQHGSREFNESGKNVKYERIDGYLIEYQTNGPLY